MIDKDLSAAQTLREATPAALSELDLPAGSMWPKAEAARRFVDGGGGVAAIASLENASAALTGTAGTLVRAEQARVA